ncbi:MAG: cytochrome c553 [Oceanospirillaceae bacterium]|jgi:cytochrome c553
MTLKRIVLSVCVLAMSQVSFAADIEKGKAAAQLCVACHGVAGVSNNDLWPNLAGQKAGYFIKQIKAFRDGTRKDATMSPMAMVIAEDQIENVAAYFASLK